MAVTPITHAMDTANVLQFLSPELSLLKFFFYIELLQMIVNLDNLNDFSRSFIHSPLPIDHK